MTALFNALLVSCPNGGGLFAVHHGQARLLDNRPTTGLSMHHGRLVRAIQAGWMVSYGESDPVYFEWAALGLDDVHDVLDTGRRIYVVSTGTNEIVEFDAGFVEISRRRYSEAPDSWHLNCLGCDREGRVFFSAFGEFEATRGYKKSAAGAGFIRSCDDNENLVTGLSQPHNVLFHESGLYIAESGSKRVCRADGGAIRMRREVDGYPRGLALVDDVLYVGLSRSRNVELGQSDIRSATVLALRKDTLDEIGRLSLPADEIYDIRYVVHEGRFEGLCRDVSAHGV